MTDQRPLFEGVNPKPLPDPDTEQDAPRCPSCGGFLSEGRCTDCFDAVRGTRR